MFGLHLVMLPGPQGKAFPRASGDAPSAQKPLVHLPSISTAVFLSLDTVEVFPVSDLIEPSLAPVVFRYGGSFLSSRRGGLGGVRG